MAASTHARVGFRSIMSKVKTKEHYFLLSIIVCSFLVNNEWVKWEEHKVGVEKVEKEGQTEY